MVHQQARQLQLGADLPDTPVSVPRRTERIKPSTGVALWRCCCRCWHPGHHSLLSETDMDTVESQRLGAAQPRVVGEELRNRGDSDDEGFLSANEEASETCQSPACGSSALPPRLGSKIVAPALSEDADDEEVAAYEDMAPTSVTSKLIDDICAEVGWDSQDSQSRLTARRFAVANAGNMQKALRHITDNKAWLQKERLRFADVPASNPLFFHRGWDRKGHPLLIYNGPRIHLVKPTSDQMVLYTSSVFQGLCDLLDSGDNLTETQGYKPLWRLQKVTMLVFLPKGAEPDIRVFGPVLTVLQRQFPERLYRAVIFPTGRTTSFLWGIAKRFLDPRTVRKVVFLDGGEKPEGLHEYIAPEYLPAEFGGKDTDPLP
mmetsp:Transcript_66081/g.123256  ORF Transcript_66081/g.123256 Transcript_66081/m.123256 type:complete len:374 (+) Transcript_66081:90-1211(+)